MAKKDEKSSREMSTDQILQREYRKMRVSAPFRLCKFCRFWLRYTAPDGINLRVFWWTMQRCLNLVMKRWKSVWEARSHSHERALGQSWWELGKTYPANTEKRPFHFDGISSLTALCGHCITCNVHRIMTSWRKKLPCISLAACLRKEHSGSFNVLNPWLSKPCNSHTRIKKS